MHLFAHFALRLDITLVLLQLCVICLLVYRLRACAHLALLMSAGDDFLPGHQLAILRKPRHLAALVTNETRLGRKRLLHALLDRLLSLFGWRKICLWC